MLTESCQIVCAPADEFVYPPSKHMAVDWNSFVLGTACSLATKFFSATRPFLALINRVKCGVMMTTSRPTAAPQGTTLLITSLMIQSHQPHVWLYVISITWCQIITNFIKVWSSFWNESTARFDWQWRMVTMRKKTYQKMDCSDAESLATWMPMDGTVSQPKATGK